MCQYGQLLSKLVLEYIARFPCNGEVNFNVSHTHIIFNNIKEFFTNQAPVMDEIDGLSMTFEDWRFNLRGSNTEPFLRHNIELRGNVALVKQQLVLIECQIQEYDVPSAYDESLLT